MGVLRMSDLREIIPVLYEDVKSIGPTDAHWHQTLLHAKLGRENELFDADGQRIDVPRFHRFEAFFSRYSAPPYLGLIDEDRQTCRLYLDGMKPLVADEIPLERGSCPGPRAEDGALIFTDAKGLLQGYERNSKGGFSPLFKDMAGRLEGRKSSGVMVVSVQSVDGKPAFRLLDRSGKPLTDDLYNGFYDDGCNFLRVQLGETWYSIKPDGTLTTQRFFPFSC